ncbi:glycoside hydrolase family 3 protein [Bifidobacterium scaligerum]|nr:glycoside hydrolase family 3 C-terminal domain-containing protein [Bifidobacterium scaligerum]
MTRQATMTSDNSSERNAFDAAVVSVRAGASAERAARELYDTLTEDERLNLLDGDVYYWSGRLDIVRHGYNIKPYVMGAIDRLGIPGIRFVDGPRGCVAGNGTAFPVSMARGATWDTELEEQVGHAIGEEVREQGGNLFGGVCINLPRHPAWGRVQETYSDQPVLLGQMGAAITRGVKSNAIACAKHFACNSMENARFKVDVTVDEATFHEVYAPHFKRTIEAGAQAVMTAYNSVNGEYCGQNSWLIDQTLRRDWGFTGIAVSDFVWGLRDVAKSVKAGLDIEEPFHQQRYTKLRAAMERGEADWSDVRAAGERILATQLRFYAQRAAAEPHGTMANAEHVALARTVAERAAVLLKNDGVAAGDNAAVSALPLRPGADLKRVAVFGRIADKPNTGDEGSSKVRAPYVVTPLQGLREIYGDDVVGYRAAEAPVVAAKRATRADAAIVVVGYTANDEGEYLKSVVSPDMLPLLPEPVTDEQKEAKAGCQAFMKEGMSTFGSDAEGGDRHSLRLLDEDVELIRAVSAANPRTIVVVVAAGAVLMDEWINEPAAVLLGWYSGMEGGHALADILAGNVDPSGRLPYSIPASEEDLPPFDSDATAATYDRWYGQRLIQHRGSKALFPLGYGLSYQAYGIEESRLLDLDRSHQTAIMQVSVRNEGDCDGRHVVQVYGTLLEGERAGERELLGFASAQVPAHSTTQVKVALDLSAIGRWNNETRTLALPQGTMRIEASSYWGDPDASTMEVEL